MSPVESLNPASGQNLIDPPGRLGQDTEADRVLLPETSWRRKSGQDRQQAQGSQADATVQSGRELTFLKRFHAGAASVKSWSGVLPPSGGPVPFLPAAGFLSRNKTTSVWRHSDTLESITKPFRPWQTTAHLILMGEAPEMHRLLDPKSVHRRPSPPRKSLQPLLPDPRLGERLLTFTTTAASPPRF